jgi:chromosome segregation ATPase
VADIRKLNKAWAEAEQRLNQAEDLLADAKRHVASAAQTCADVQAQFGKLADDVQAAAAAEPKSALAQAAAETAAALVADRQALQAKAAAILAAME